MNPIFEQFPAFRRLQNDPEAFGHASTDHGGYGIVWDSELDLFCDELWNHGIPLASNSGAVLRQSGDKA